MNTKEKLQRVLDVIDGRAHPSTLVKILPAPDVQEENVFKMAVDYLMARELYRIGAKASNQFRLVVSVTKEVREGEGFRKEQQVVHTTEWMPEHSQTSAPMLMGQGRQ